MRPGMKFCGRFMPCCRSIGKKKRRCSVWRKINFCSSCMMKQKRLPLSGCSSLIVRFISCIIKANGCGSYCPSAFIGCSLAMNTSRLWIMPITHVAMNRIIHDTVPLMNFPVRRSRTRSLSGRRLKRGCIRPWTNRSLWFSFSRKSG